MKIEDLLAPAQLLNNAFLSPAHYHLFARDYLHDMGKQDLGFVVVWLNYHF